jgi:hypothetical protein
MAQPASPTQLGWLYAPREGAIMTGLLDPDSVKPPQEESPMEEEMSLKPPQAMDMAAEEDVESVKPPE